MINAVYILSAGRSGSTLLNLIVGTHSRMTAVGEVTLLPKHISLNSPCTCNQPLRSCELWSQAVRRLSEELHTDLWQHPDALDLGFMGNRRLVEDQRTYARYRRAWQVRHAPVYLSLRSRVALPSFVRKRFDDTVRARLNVYAAVRVAAGREIVVDSSKAYLPGLELYRCNPLRVRLILLTRDGRASFFSRLRGNYGDRADCMRAWRDYYQHALPLLRGNVAKEHLLQIKYEDLAVSPEQTLQRICTFLAIDYQASMLDFRSTVHHVIGGNNMRFRTDNAIALDTAWRTDLADADAAYFERAAGAVNRQLGYE